MTIGIYMITNTINNKKYIGQSINIKRRKSEHFTKQCNMVISKSIFNYGKENFDFKILKECEESQLDELEIKYIIEYKSNNREFGYNIENGGNGIGKISEDTKQKIKESTTGYKNHFYGKKHTEDVKNKIKEHHKNNENYSFHGKHTEETLQKMRDSNKRLNLGVPMKDEIKIKISNSIKGKIISDETKQKMSEASKGKNLGNGKYDLYSIYNNNKNYRTNFNYKTKSISIDKYPNLGQPLIICTRICMENEIYFKSNLLKDIENFVQNFDLKTIININ